MRRAVFLDRDGVVNRAVLREGKPYPPATLSDLRLLPGVREACNKLREAGFALILITNQPDIARGLVSAEQVSEMNRRLQSFLQLDDVGVCPHDDSGALLLPQAAAGAAARSGSRLEHRSGIELHRRRPLARHRSRPSRRMPRDFRRLRLRRTASGRAFRAGPLVARSRAMDFANHSSGLSFGIAAICLTSLLSASRSSPMAPTALPSWNSRTIHGFGDSPPIPR